MHKWIMGFVLGLLATTVGFGTMGQMVDRGIDRVQTVTRALLQ